MALRVILIATTMHVFSKSETSSANLGLYCGLLSICLVSSIDFARGESKRRERAREEAGGYKLVVGVSKLINAQH